jgi:acyl-CoA dehydrogenase
MDELFSNAVGQLLAGQCTPAVVRAIEAGGSPQPLWRHIEESGFADALVSEAQGGAGLSLAELFPVFELCGRHALPLPLAETMLARALLAQAGVARPAGSISLAQCAPGADGGVDCATVHGGLTADWVLVATAGASVLLPRATARMTPVGFCLDAAMAWSAAAVADGRRLPGFDVRTLQGCVHAAQLAGALMAVFERTLAYANERSQFGRPIGKFQAIQHQLAVISEHAFAARMAAQIGCHSASATPDRLRVALAKARASEAALEVAALSHSIHGAIGFTEEFDLQLHTRRLHAWRQAAGSESYWHAVAGAALVDQHQGLTLDLIRIATDFH